MTPLGADVPRRVKGLLRDAGIDAGRRAGWPVVLAGEEIVWIPGVRRSLAATARSGRPVVRYFCEPLDDR
jgi:tRNA(Ile)-lysidine synthase